MPTTLDAARKEDHMCPTTWTEHAFTSIYDAYSPALFGVLNQVLQNKVLAEDALQNTFVKIWIHRNSYDAAKASLFTWMLNIARHEAIDMLRSRQYRKAKNTMALKESNLALVNNMFSRLDFIDVQKHLRILQPKVRTILELCFFRGFSCPQTAELLQMPVGSVKTRLQYSYKKLRKTFLFV